MVNVPTQEEFEALEKRVTGLEETVLSIVALIETLKPILQKLNEMIG